MEKEWNKYPVFHIDFNGGNYLQEGESENTIEDCLSKWESEYGKGEHESTVGNRFQGVLQRASECTGHRAVVLTDEYDKPILDVLDTEACTRDREGEKVLLEDRHRNILRSFYPTFKSADNYLQFVPLTGVTKFSQVSAFSGFNQPNDISMDNRYEALCGIPEMEKYIYTFEFKLDKSAKEALRQIEEHGYARPYATDSRRIACIGVNFSSETRTVEGWEEVWMEPHRR